MAEQASHEITQLKLRNDSGTITRVVERGGDTEGGEVLHMQSIPDRMWVDDEGTGY